MFRGRPAKRPDILGVRELRIEEVVGLKRGAKPAVKALRDSHHMVARLFAMGLRPGEVASRAGYSLNRVSTLYADPAFKDLIAGYRDSVNDEWRESVDEYFDTISANRTIAARRINDKLTDDSEDISLRELVAIHADAADRTGYPKRSVAVNVNLDFAAKLDAAISRSNKMKTIDAPQAGLPAPSASTGRAPVPPSRSSPPRLIEGEIKRRA